MATCVTSFISSLVASSSLLPSAIYVGSTFYNTVHGLFEETTVLALSPSIITVQTFALELLHTRISSFLRCPSSF